VHALAGHGVEETEYALIHGAQWHESLVENAVTGAEKLAASWIGSVRHPAEPAFLARVEAKAKVDAG
jgi:hypothetical protein